MQGFNMGRYVPPELEGIASFNQASNKKPTNRKADGSQTVRFECPFAIWCTTCQPEQIIAQGVRFNAEKTKVGNYYNTPIWQFRIKHTTCGGWIEVQTDPKNAEYIVVSGGRRREYGRGEDLMLDGKAAHEVESVLGQLEKKAAQKEEVSMAQTRVQELQRRQEIDWNDPYEVNRRVRKEFRVGRRERQHGERTGDMLQEKYGLGLDMVAPTIADEMRAKLIDFGGDGKLVVKGMFERQQGQKIEDGPGGTLRSTLQSSLNGITRARNDPFTKDATARDSPKRRKLDQTNPTTDEHMNGTAPPTISKSRTATTCLVAYDSD